MSKRIAIILAGGLGKRMCSPMPKVLHSINNKSMIIHILENCVPIVDKVFIVVGKFHREIEFAIKTQMPTLDIREKIRFVSQFTAKGTGHAVQCIKKDPFSGIGEFENEDTRALILSGDVPLISRETMLEMFEVGDRANTKIATTRMETPVGYGRVLIGENGDFLRIVEERDATEEERREDLVNCGVYSFNAFSLFDGIMKLENKNSQGEYYLTDMVEIIGGGCGYGGKVEMMEIRRERQYEVMGVNTMEQLARLREYFMGLQ